MIGISTPDAPRPAGHYSQAIVHNGVVAHSPIFGTTSAQPISMAIIQATASTPSGSGVPAARQASEQCKIIKQEAKI